MFFIIEKIFEKRLNMRCGCEYCCMVIVVGIVCDGIVREDLFLLEDVVLEDVVFGLWLMIFGV